MNRHIFAASLVLTALALGCSSSSSPSAPPPLFCSASLAGSALCYGYSNLTSDQQTAVTNSCTQSLMGKIVSACPTDKLVGCCKYTAGGITTEECFYNGGGGDGGAPSGLSTDQSVCSSENGTWTTSQ